ncbi:MAG: hypothetical protein SFW36_21765 [Leptolyngbyaceae cyanobacterium bins.59]|nr:hypothetical protein [Leptolyngbyaceae cyanobacterium bins.59]
MIAMKQEWQAQRQQRQAEVAQRQQGVRAFLGASRQQFQLQTAEVRSRLETFRDRLNQADAARREEAALDKAELQEFRSNLQQTVQDFLTATREERQINTAKLLWQLNEYTEALQRQTREFLKVSAIDHFLMAQQLTQDLQEFRDSLTQFVLSLRQEIRLDLDVTQAWVQDLQAETQNFLAATTQQRNQMRTQLLTDLAQFTDRLGLEVERCLSVFAMMRQERADDVQQTLAESRSQRLAEVQTLFNDLAQFRTVLKNSHRDLQQTVWGTSGGQKVTAPARSAMKATPAKASAIKSSRPVPTRSKLPAQPASKVTARPQVPNPPARPIAPNTVLPRPSVTEPAPLITESVDVGKAVYSHLHTVQGARLSEIEAALKLNRFQAVDALHSLIQKGLVVQRDRSYYVVDEASVQ